MYFEAIPTAEIALKVPRSKIRLAQLDLFRRESSFHISWVFAHDDSHVLKCVNISLIKLLMREISALKNA